VSVRLLIGPNGSGKTTRALREFGQFTPLQQHQSVRFVVPGISQVLDLRRLVLSRETHESPGTLGDPFCTFRRLAEELLGARPITETQKRLLLGTLPIPEYFRPSPNLPAALSTIIRTLKRSLVTPEDLRSAAVHLSGTSQPKVSALSDVYRSYEDSLAARDLQDFEGILIQALSHEVPWKLVIIDGFTRLYPVQLELIRHLADSCDVLVTSESLPPKTYNLRPTTLASLPPNTQHPTPNTLTSLEGVASEIRKLLRQGFSLDEIAVSARDLRPYQQKIARIFDEYGIRLATEVYPLAKHSFDSPDRCQWTRKDCAAWKATQRIMSELQAAETLLGRKLKSDALASAVARTTFRVSNGSGVTLSDIDMLGGRKFRVLFIIESPERPRSEDPFLLDFEREVLNPHLSRPLELSTDHRDDFDPASSATERLYLVCESEADFLPTIEEAESLNALRRRTILDCSTAEDEDIKHTAAVAYNLLLEHGEIGPECLEPIPDQIEEAE
jgi:hypothetical protein